jgi:sn-glycerol 3-phosphate transport system permease protein
MVDSSRVGRLIRHLLLVAAVGVIAFPVYVSFVASTHSLDRIMSVPMPLTPSLQLLDNYHRAMTEGPRIGGERNLNVFRMGLNSLIVAVGITLGKIATALLAAYALVYFRFPGRSIVFALVFVTLMLPVEVRILPTYAVVASLRLLNSYAGLIIPLIASATATFMFRQFFRSVPDELTEAAIVDGCGPLRFFAMILVPIARTSIAAMAVIQFIYGWNQYLWPLLITTKPKFYTILIGISRMLQVGDHQAEWHIIMASAILAMLPPLFVIVSMQRQFIAGMIEREK